jgi:ribosomal protein S8
MYKSSHFFYIDTYSLKRFYKYEFKKLLFLLTDKGLIDHHLALKKNIGGKLYFILY